MNSRVSLFEVLNKNEVLAIIEVNTARAYILKVQSQLPRFLNDINSWIDARTSPIGRKNIQILLKSAGITGKIEYLRVTHCISFTDTLWVRELGDNLTWNKINPYRNRLSKVISEIALNGGYIGGNLKSPSPDYTVDGSADKCWKRENGKIYLYKTTEEKWSGISGNRPYCEYYACQVARQLIDNSSDYVKYSIKVSKTDSGRFKAYVKCPLFTSEKLGYLPIGNSNFESKGLIELDKVLNSESRLRLREMLILDALILNPDRHKWNYGFLYNNDTFDIIGLAPIFDNDCSFGYNISLQSNSIKEAYNIALGRPPRTDLGGYIRQARMSLTSNLTSNMKNMYPFHFNRIPQEIDLDNKRIQFIEYIVNSQIKAILSDE